MHWVMIDAPGVFRGFLNLATVETVKLTDSGELSIHLLDGSELWIPAKEAGEVISRLRDLVTMAVASRPTQLDKLERKPRQA